MEMERVRRLVKHMGRVRTLGLAAEVSFWLFLALVPLAVVAGLVVAKLAVAGTSGAALPLLSSLPEPARDLLESEVRKIAALEGGAVALPALAVFVWLGASGVHSVFDAFEIEASCERPWWKKRVLAIGTCVLLSGGVAAVALLGTGLEWVWRISGARVPALADVESSGGGQVLRFVLGALVSLGLTSALYALGVPASVRRAMPILPGAILALTLEMVFGLGYAFYVSRAGTGSAYLAGLAAVGVTMTALYLEVLALLVGLELNVVLREGRTPKPRAHVPVPT
jgi:membrane protein